MTARRLGLVVVLLALFFAVQGGEYSTWDQRTLKRQEREERARIEALEQEVDSLKRVAEAAETDLATQERLAREQYSMVRPGEKVYIILADSLPPQ